MAIGEEIRRPEHIAEAGATLALAYVCMAAGADRLDAAQTAIETACRHRRARRTLSAPVLAGIIALRRGDRWAAEDAFVEVEGEAGGLLAQDDRTFDALDALGVAQCGRAVIGEDATEALKRAVIAFEAARALTVARGVVGRVVRLLNELEEVAPPGLMNVPRQVAAGQGVTGQSGRA